MPSDNHAVVDGRVTSISFRRLGQDGIAQTSLHMVVPALGEQPPVTVHAAFFGRMAESAYEIFRDNTCAQVSGWLQSRRRSSGSRAMDLVGERFRLLDTPSGANHVYLFGQITNPPYFSHPRGRPYLRFQLLVRRDRYPARGRDTTDLIRVVLRDDLAIKMVHLLSPGAKLWLTGHIRSRWRKGKIEQEVLADHLSIVAIADHAKDAEPARQRAPVGVVDRGTNGDSQEPHS